ncbi:UNVERIFIED_CONTAM: hypothetical protein Sradi_3337800 [Sesamum radiatum]|uniref:Uncharacterized protein n=1 Tax=Sesamum radiatum TaxID=300843 RepID=A0AAW2R2R0_SESRA
MWIFWCTFSLLLRRPPPPFSSSAEDGLDFFSLPCFLSSTNLLSPPTKNTNAHTSYAYASLPPAKIQMAAKTAYSRKKFSCGAESILERWNMQRQWSSAVCKSNKLRVCCREVKVEESTSVRDDEACELVNGDRSEHLEMVSGLICSPQLRTTMQLGYCYCQIFLVFEDSATRDFAYRVACTGYK